MKDDKEYGYCVDYCPIYFGITEYNRNHKHKIYCTSAMCEYITDTVMQNDKEESEANNEQTD